MMLVTHPAVRRAARELFRPGAFVNEVTIFRFEHKFNCKIDRVSDDPTFAPLVPKIIFNSEQDEILFILRWS